MDEQYNKNPANEAIKKDASRSESYATRLIDANIARVIDQSVSFFRGHISDSSLPTQRSFTSNRPYFSRREHRIS